MPKPITFDKCPECGEPLEATAEIYLSDVVVDADGFVKSYRVAFDGAEPEQNLENSKGNGSINFDQSDRVRIYCPNDHEFDVAAAKRARRKEKKQHGRKNITSPLTC